MKTQKRQGEPWSLTAIANASGRSLSGVRVLAMRLLPAELLEERAGRGGALQLPESVALALVPILKVGALTPQLIDALKEDPAMAKAAANGLAELAELATMFAMSADGEAAA